jgi:hypothetical protein
MPKKNIKKRKQVEYIKYVFSQEEKEQIANDMALSLSEKESAEQRLKEIQKSIKAEIEAFQTKISTLSRHYSNGYTYQNTDCEVEYDFSARTVRTFRADNGEFISSRPMKANELQADIFDDSAILAEEEVTA